MKINEFERLPEKDGIQELLDGEVVEIPPRKHRHAEICRAIEAILLRHFDKSRVWWGIGFLIGGHCPAPDLAVIHPDQPLEHDWFAGAPMIAVEVASRGNTPDELEFKKDLYLARGAREVWIVYNKTRSVVVHTATGAVTHRRSFSSEALGAEVEVREIFGS